MKEIRRILYLYLLEIWITSPWGRCFGHKAFDLYKNGPVFKERAIVMGHLGAAKAFTFWEMQYLKKSLWRDWRFILSVFPWPYTTLRLLEEQDELYKMAITQQNR